MIQGKRLRIYYMAQVAAHPPRFILFVNFPELMLESYKKYIINQFREQYTFKGVPLIFELRGKKHRDEDHPIPVSQHRQDKPKAILVNPDENSDDAAFEALPDLQEEIDPSYFS